MMPSSPRSAQASNSVLPSPSNCSLNWIRLSATTHSFNQNQRINHLIFTQTGGALNVTTPASANLCPPGHYMLFILKNGVPSISQIMQIQ